MLHKYKDVGPELLEFLHLSLKDIIYEIWKSPYYKDALLWDNLPVMIKNSMSLRHLEIILYGIFYKRITFRIGCANS